jgi:hypothetical protein
MPDVLSESASDEGQILSAGNTVIDCFSYPCISINHALYGGFSAKHSTAEPIYSGLICLHSVAW